jgi:hypothetical protein
MLASPIRVILIVSAIVSVAACRSASQSAFGQQESPVDQVSLDAVISEPRAFEGRHLRVHGVLRLEFEGNALYTSEAGLQARDEKRSLWIVLNPAYLRTSRNTLSRLSGHRVVVEGTVMPGEHGHMGLWPAEFTYVTYIAIEGTK